MSTLIFTPVNNARELRVSPARDGRVKLTAVFGEGSRTTGSVSLRKLRRCLSLKDGEFIDFNGVLRRVGFLANGDMFRFFFSPTSKGSGVVCVDAVLFRYALGKYFD